MRRELARNRPFPKDAPGPLLQFRHELQQTRDLKIRRCLAGVPAPSLKISLNPGLVLNPGTGDTAIASTASATPLLCQQLF